MNNYQAENLSQKRLTGVFYFVDEPGKKIP